MFRHGPPVATCRRTPSVPNLTFAVIALMLMLAADALAQGPPDNLAGAGPVILEGDLEVSYEDDDERGHAKLLHFLHSEKKRIPLQFQGGVVPDLPTGAKVRIAGDVAEGVVTAQVVTALAVPAAQTLGPKNILVILFNFSNDPRQPFSPATIASINEQVRGFYLENTYGQAVLSFTVAGWYTIDATNGGCDYYGWAGQAETMATNAGVNLSAFDRRVFAFPRTSSCNWGGMGNVSGPRSWTNGSYTLRTIAHEQGHNFGNHHSKSMPCDPACSVVEYGDDRDVMGRPGTVGHMNAFQKERLGWLNYGSAPAIRTVTASGDYWIDNYETPAGLVKALKIFNPATGGHYYVESRAPLGFDSSVAPGVTMHSSMSSIGYQVDFAPSTSAYDSTLDVGQTFTDATLGLSVQTLSSSLDGAHIRVTISGAAPCSAQPPTVSIAAAGSLSYTVTVTNNNSSSCGASVVNVSANVPSGWSASFFPSSSATLEPGASASTTLTLVAPSGTSGSFSFTVSGTDSASGLSGSATGSAVVSTTTSPLTVTATAEVTAGKGSTSSAIVTVTAKFGLQPAPGATASVVVTDPQGRQTQQSAAMGAEGAVSLTFSIKPKDPRGTYSVQATATSGGTSAQATTTFDVQ